MPKIAKLKGRCPEGKIRFKDAQMAIQALHRMQNAAARAIEIGGNTKRAEKRHYFCGKCNGFHVTSQEKQQFYSQQEAA
jgi:hypothetical protein